MMWRQSREKCFLDRSIERGAVPNPPYAILPTIGSSGWLWVQSHAASRLCPQGRQFCTQQSNPRLPLGIAGFSVLEKVGIASFLVSARNFRIRRARMIRAARTFPILRPFLKGTGTNVV